VKIAAQFMPGDLPVFIDSVRKAEDCGFARAWLVEGQLLWRNSYVYMTHGLAATERMPFGTAVTNPYTRHYTVTANVIATLSELHPGRVILGIARGDNALRTLGREPVPTTELEAVVPRLRELIAGHAVPIDGNEARIAWASEELRVPIMMAATGPRNLRLAGSLADIVMLQVGVDPVAVTWAIDHVRAGAETAGRDPDEVEITLYCAMWITDDLAEARRMTAWSAACAANHLRAVARSNREHGMPPVLTRVAELPRGAYDYASHLDPTLERAEYPDDVVDAFAINGPPERCVEILENLAAVGVDEVAPCYLNGRFDQMEIVGREILPALAALPA
jgi:alkanesulfonate monooxygenase SsuD/methylene tetrahydromethanopterin reductase-like flavin-dependent oxidoreductase (luciferase family)